MNGIILVETNIFLRPASFHESNEPISFIIAEFTFFNKAEGCIESNNLLFLGIFWSQLNDSS